MRALLLACGLLLAALAAAAQPADSFVVLAILVDGKRAQVVDDPLLAAVLSADRQESHRLAVGQAVAPGTRITTGPGVLVQIARERPSLQIVVEPGTRLTLQRDDPDAVSAEVGQGRAGFTLLGRLDFYFSVGSFQKVFAIAKGTRFSVAADPQCSAGEGHGCVTIDLDEGRLEVETRRPVALGAASTAGASAVDKPPSGEADFVSLGDALTAGQTRTFALDPAQFAVRFDTWSQADEFFSAELQRADAQTDPQALMRAVRNLVVIKRLGARADEASVLAAQGLELARARGDRLWEFRFLIDQAFATWQQKRDPAALPLFAQAFAMTDVTGSSLAPADLADLYGRYGGMRFEARDRATPARDLDEAEDYTRRALRLRELESGGRATLDLAWSHYGLGVLLRIGRSDYENAALHLERAVAMRREVLGPRDDILTASMLTDEALTREQLAYQRAAAGAIADDVLMGQLSQVQGTLESSLAMLSRLFPAADNRSNGAVSRRTGDFHSRRGDWLAEHHQPERAAADYAQARRRYEEALAAFAHVAENTSAERRFAYLGLGKVELRGDHLAAAAKALRTAYDLALEERCAASPEAPSPEWMSGLVAQLAVAMERSGDPVAARQLRREGAAPAAAACGPSVPPQAPASGTPR